MNDHGVKRRRSSASITQNESSFNSPQSQNLSIVKGIDGLEAKKSSNRRPLLVSDLRNHAPGLRRPQSQRLRAVETLLEHGFPYSRTLNAHTSCVNALAFSSLDGRFLASGGDDLNINLWDLHEERVSTPCCSFKGPIRNIFVLSFSAHDRFIFSGGADDIVLKYDASQLGRPLTPQPARYPNSTFRQHDDSIRGIAPHPTQDEIFITGSEDGRLILHDGRTGSGARLRPQDTIQLMADVTGVEFHPIMEHIFATSDSRGRVCLRDTRMGFGPLVQRTQEGVVQIYNTKLSRRGRAHLSNPETSSISFNREGTQLGVTMLNYFPTIYALADADPIAVCSGMNLPDGTPVPPAEPTYANVCTMKHGGFGGPGLDADSLYVAGSDDFRAYVWALPPPDVLAAQRTVLSYAEWDARADMGLTAFAESPTGPRCIPAQLDTPRARLGGHASIVNTVLVHPRMLLAATAGVEASIVLHGAVDSMLGGMKRTDTRTRKIGEAWVPDVPVEGDESEGSGVDWDWDDWVEGERSTIRMFDEVLRDEGKVDVFAVRRWFGSDGGAESDSDSEDEEEEENSDGHGDPGGTLNPRTAGEEDVEMEESRFPVWQWLGSDGRAESDSEEQEGSDSW